MEESIQISFDGLCLRRGNDFEFILDVDSLKTQNLKVLLSPILRRSEIKAEDVGLFNEEFGYKRIQDILVPSFFSADFPAIRNISLVDQMQIPYIKDGKIKKQPVDFSYFNATEKPLEILAIHFPNELKSGSFPFVGEELVSEHLNMAAFLSKLHEKKLSFHSISNISNMRISPSNGAPSLEVELNHYIETAHEIVQNQAFPFSSIIDSLIQSDREKHFYFLCGPSWSGKTQFVYILDRMAKFQMSRQPCASPYFCAVLHFIVGSGTKDVRLYQSQPIYEVHDAASSSLIRAIKKDIEIMRNIFILESQKSPFNEDFDSILDFAKINRSTLESVKQDREKLKDFLDEELTESILVSTKFLELASNLCPWISLGVIKTLIEYRISGGRVVIDHELQATSLSLADFGNFIDQMTEIEVSEKAKLRLPVIVCLDEFNLPKNESEALPLVMLRNLLRISRVVPVLLGTNARVSNLVGPLSTNFELSRDKGRSWCKLITKFPPMTTSSFDILGIPHEMKFWLSKSPFRPGISRDFIPRLCSKKGDLVTAASNTLLQMVTDKVKLLDPGCILGYFQMLFSGYRVCEPAYGNPSSLIHKHLAHLCVFDESYKIVDIPPLVEISKRGDGSLCIDDGMDLNLNFEPHSIYLNLNEDELIQCILMIGWTKIVNLKSHLDLWKRLMKNMKFKNARNEDNFALEKAQTLHILASIGKFKINILSCPFRLLVEYLWRTTFIPAAFKVNSNERDGKKMECLVLGSIVKASASAGPKGSALKLFLPLFVSELQLYNSGPLELTENALGALKSIKDQLVPFTVAVGHQLSVAFRKIPGAYTGSLPDIKNIQCIDGCLSPDWVDTLSAGRLNHLFPPKPPNQEYDEEILKIAHSFSNKKTCQLYITLEMKNYERNIGYDKINDILKRAKTNGRGFYGQPLPSIKTPKHHLHLIVLSSIAKLEEESISKLSASFSESMRLLEMRFDKSTKKIDLVDMFPVTQNFLSIVIIIPIETLFGHGFESAAGKICSKREAPTGKKISSKLKNPAKKTKEA